MKFFSTRDTLDPISWKLSKRNFSLKLKEHVQESELNIYTSVNLRVIPVMKALVIVVYIYIYIYIYIYETAKVAESCVCVCVMGENSPDISLNQTLTHHLELNRTVQTILS